MEIRKRNTEMDFLRGIAVLGVIAIHVSASLLINESMDKFSFVVSLFINQLSRFSVPAFLFVSGFLAYKSYQKKSYTQFLISKIRPLLIPYISWTLISFVLVFPNSFAGILRTLLAGDGAFNHLYYIPLLFQCFVVFPILLVIGESHKRILYSLITTLFLTGIYETYLYLAYGEWTINTNFLLRSTFFVWAIYFAVGIFVAKNYEKIKQAINLIKNKHLFISYISTLMLMLLDCYFFMNQNNLAEFVWSFRPSVIIYSLASIVLLFKLGLQYNNKIIDKIYINSFGIYLSHIGVIIVLQIFANFLFSNVFMSVIAFLITLIFSYIITEIIKITPFALLLLGEKQKAKISVESNKNIIS